MRKCLADLPVEDWHVFLVFHALAVRRIGDDKAIFLRMAQLVDRPLLEMDEVCDAGTSGIFSGRFHDERVDVIPLDVHIHIDIYQILRLLKSPLPHGRRDQVRPLLCLKGTATFDTGDTDYTVSENMFFSISSGETFYLRSRSDDFEADAIIFDDAILKKTAQGLINIYFMNVLREHPLQRIPENKTGLCHEICSYLRRILQENDNFFQKQIIGNYLEILFYEGCNLMLHDPKNGAFIRKKPGSKKNKIADSFLLAVEKGIRTSRQVEYYADELNMSAKYLYAVVKEVTGKTPTEWINEYTLTEAKIMLKNSDTSIQNISYDLGFATPSHFGKFFREKTGMTPKEFRKTARGGEI